MKPLAFAGKKNDSQFSTYSKERHPEFWGTEPGKTKKAELVEEGREKKNRTLNWRKTERDSFDHSKGFQEILLLTAQFP